MSDTPAHEDNTLITKDGERLELIRGQPVNLPNSWVSAPAPAQVSQPPVYHYTSNDNRQWHVHHPGGDQTLVHSQLHYYQQQNERLSTEAKEWATARGDLNSKINILERRLEEAHTSWRKCDDHWKSRYNDLQNQVEGKDSSIAALNVQVQVLERELGATKEARKAAYAGWVYYHDEWCKGKEKIEDAQAMIVVLEKRVAELERDG
ncbi:Nn.00g044030.m01.CDS01 [Neocucurbitaria sp. VM-36]